MANGDLGIRLTRNPNGNQGQPVLIGGVELLTTQSEQSSGADAPGFSMESGLEIRQRNTTIPNSGTITGAVESSGLGALRRQARRREFVRITTPEGSINRCVVEEVQRTREGGFIDKFEVDVTWAQIFTANVGTVQLRAVTQDGPKSGSAGSNGGGQQSLVGSNTQTTQNGPQAEADAPTNASGPIDEFVTNTQQTANDAAATLGNLGNAIGGWAASTNDQIGNAIGLGPTGGDDT